MVATSSTHLIQHWWYFMYLSIGAKEIVRNLIELRMCVSGYPCFTLLFLLRGGASTRVHVVQVRAVLGYDRAPQRHGLEDKEMFLYGQAKRSSQSEAGVSMGKLFHLNQSCERVTDFIVRLSRVATSDHLDSIQWHWLESLYNLYLKIWIFYWSFHLREWVTWQHITTLVLKEKSNQFVNVS